MLVALFSLSPRPNDILLGPYSQELFLHYLLQVEVFHESKKIAGINTIRYQIKSPHSVMQIDLQRPMNIDSVFQAGK